MTIDNRLLKILHDKYHCLQMLIINAQNSVDKQLSEDAPWKRSRAWKPLHWATTTPNSLKVSS